MAKRTKSSAREYYDRILAPYPTAYRLVPEMHPDELSRAMAADEQLSLSAWGGGNETPRELARHGLDIQGILWLLGMASQETGFVDTWKRIFGAEIEPYSRISAALALSDYRYYSMARKACLTILQRIEQDYEHMQAEIKANRSGLIERVAVNYTLAKKFQYIIDRVEIYWSDERRRRWAEVNDIYSSIPTRADVEGDLSFDVMTAREIPSGTDGAIILEFKKPRRS